MGSSITWQPAWRRNLIGQRQTWHQSLTNHCTAVRSGFGTQWLFPDANYNKSSTFSNDDDLVQSSPGIDETTMWQHRKQSRLITMYDGSEGIVDQEHTVWVKNIAHPIKPFAQFSFRLGLSSLYFRDISPFFCQCISTHAYEFWSTYLNGVNFF